MQGEKAQVATATARRADIRRAAYVEYAASCRSFESTSTYLLPLLNSKRDQNKKRREYEEGYIARLVERLQLLRS
ncbi:hypothetical protein ACFY7C_36545 [Streptomyces sp. NPDC012769]|uniref:hypothetical protein n=1 Tax=Streptomyces sp. NPDC012769 TaxID=3364848 RepID=UPI0036B98785